MSAIAAGGRRRGGVRRRRRAPRRAARAPDRGRGRGLPRPGAGRARLYSRAGARRGLSALRAPRRLARRLSRRARRWTSRRCTARRSRTTCATRDFTVNAIARPLAGGELVDPLGGEADLEARTLRAVGPERLRGTTRCGSCAPSGSRTSSASGSTAETEALVRAATPRSSREPAGRADPRASSSASRRTASAALDELGLLAPLGGSTERLDARRPGRHAGLRPAWSSSARRCGGFPISNELGRLARTLLRRAPGRTTRRARSTASGADRAVGALGARLPGRDRALRRRPRARERPIRPEPLLRGDDARARPRAGPGDRPPARARRGGARGRHDLDARARRSTSSRARAIEASAT